MYTLASKFGANVHISLQFTLATTYICTDRAVGAGEACLTGQDFGRSVNPISTKEGCNRGVACSLLNLG